jgi:hypothetical protein
LAGFHNYTCRFMAQYHGIKARRIAHTALRIGVHIRTADSHGIDANLYFSRRGIGQVVLNKLKLALCGKLGDARFHGRSSLGASRNVSPAI